MNDLQILTHRGLESSKKNYFVENSCEAFIDHSNRGFGLEFDVNFTKDNRIIVFHDSSLKRITQGQDKRLFLNMSFKEIKSLRLNGNKLCDLEELLGIIRKSKANLNALHLKGKFQEKKYLNILLNSLEQNKDILRKIIIFNVKINTAKHIKSRLPQAILAPSVAHLYDIKRYNLATKGTLMFIEEAIRNRIIFDWVWLDEWDRTNENNSIKTLYNEENFNILKNHGFKIALVAPELHATSPNLIGGESHQDARNIETLKKRIGEIIKLEPDAICTDYPEMIKELIAQSKSCSI